MQQFLEGRTDEFMIPSYDLGLAALLRMKKAAYFTSMESVYANDASKCDVLMPWRSDFPNLLGMALADGSPYYEMFQYQTLKLREVGAWQVMRKSNGLVYVLTGQKRVVAFVFARWSAQL